MDEIAGKMDEKVIIQIGHTKYKPKNAEYFDFASYDRIKKMTKEARIVVSHAGVGSIITTFEQNTNLLIVPRLKEYDEAIDNHQLEISEVISHDERVCVIYDLNELEKLINKNFITQSSKAKNILSTSLKQYIISLTQNQFNSQ